MKSNRMLGMIKRFASDSRGSAALISILAAIPVVAAAGLAIDYSRTVRATSELQDVADAAALAAAAGKNISGSASQKQLARKAIANKYITDSLPKVSDVEIIGSPTITVGPNTVDVAINARVKGSLLNVLNALPDDAEMDSDDGGGDSSRDFEFTIHTKAGFNKDSYLCLLSLNPHEQEAVYFQGNSEFMASTCTVQANSDHATAMRTWGNAYAEAEDFCSVGGWTGSGFEPDPSTGCTTKTDPYASLVLPTAGACITAAEIPAADVKPSGVTVKNTTASLVPGTYCGGLSIQTATAVANLAPGLYIIKDGDLSVTANATLNAPVGVVIYLTGNASNIDITSGTTVTLKGPTAATAVSSTTAYVGFALMQDRTTGAGNVNTITSGGAVNITGAAYMPNQNLTIWANGDMNAASPYFPMIVDSLDMSGDGTLHVNLDWTLAGFPEPVALKKKAKVLLTQ